MTSSRGIAVFTVISIIFSGLRYTSNKNMRGLIADD